VLTDTKLKPLRLQEKLYKVSDRDGLYVAVLTQALSRSVMTGALTGPGKADDRAVWP